MPKHSTFSPIIRQRLLTATLIAAATFMAACSGNADKPATATSAAGPGNDASWTGASRPQDVITARFHLMEQMEQLMLPIDMLEVEKGGDAKQRAVNAAAIGAMLQAVPHLFPSTTDLYDPKAEQPVTIALPAIWKDFDTFYGLAGAAVKAADNFAAAQGEDAQKAAGMQLRASCDACHVLFLRKYEGPKVKASDADLDFDALVEEPK